MKSRGANRTFSLEEKEYIINNHSVMMVKDIAFKLKVGRNRITAFKKLVGLPISVKRKFSENEIKFMVSNKKKGSRYVSLYLNRSINSVKEYYRSNNLTKPKAKVNPVRLIDSEAAFEELSLLIQFTYQGSMFQSAYERVKYLNHIINHG